MSTRQDTGGAPSPQLAAALFYLSLGWSVVPTHKVTRPTGGGATFCSCPAGSACASKGKHPAVAWTRYQTEAADEGQLRVWFGPGGAFASYGVGVITGAVSNIFVLDADEGPGKQGADTLLNLQTLNGDLSFTVQARTGGGGRHMIYRHPRDVWVTTGRNVLGPGLDVRGDGGFIVASPSLHESGAFYLWDEAAHPRTTPIAAAPPWVVEMASGEPPDVTGTAAPRRAPDGGTGEIIRDAWGKVTDGRERHMVGIVCAVIAELTRENGALPTVETVIAEAWPSYERTTRARGDSLEADGRGIGLMRQRAGHMLRRAASGKWKVDPFTKGAASARDGPDTGDTRSDTGGGTGKLPPILDAAAFLATFTMPDYLVDGVIQRGRLHALTSPTGHGKTAVALFLACMMGMGRNIGALEVTQGNVLFMGGENPDDLCVRLHAACRAYGIMPGMLPVYVMPGNFPVTPEAAEELKRKIDGSGVEFSLIIGDSLAAYFPGDDENHNVQMGNYARNWRVLTTCAGRPAVMALAHPIKAATRDTLLPRGGGAFLAEIDANLVLWAEGERETTALHWQGKIRGADFQPVTFALTPVTLTDKVDAKGRALVSVVAVLQTAEQADISIKAAFTNENVVLEWLRRHPGISVRDIAANAGWLSEAGKPHVGKVQRLLASLNHLKLARKWRGKWKITPAGEAELAGESS